MKIVTAVEIDDVFCFIINISVVFNEKIIFLQLISKYYFINLINFIN